MAVEINELGIKITIEDDLRHPNAKTENVQHLDEDALQQMRSDILKECKKLLEVSQRSSRTKR